MSLCFKVQRNVIYIYQLVFGKMATVDKYIHIHPKEAGYVITMLLLTCYLTLLDTDKLRLRVDDILYYIVFCCQEINLTEWLHCSLKIY